LACELGQLGVLDSVRAETTGNFYMFRCRYTFLGYHTTRTSEKFTTFRGGIYIFEVLFFLVSQLVDVSIDP
jgi:hypothetical protein